MITLDNFDAGAYLAADLIAFLQRLQAEMGQDCRVSFDAGHNNISITAIRKDGPNEFTEFRSEDDIAKDWKKT